MKLRFSWPAVVLVAGCGGGGGGGGGNGVGPPAGTEQISIVAASEQGMQFVDRESSVFSLLPPYSVVRAQVVRQKPGGKARILDPYDVEVTYEAVADPAGSINSKSVGKTDFWQHSGELFGVALQPGESLGGLWMPADAPVPGPQPMTFHDGPGWFVAQGIPLTPLDDAGQANPFPLLRIKARDVLSGAELARLDVVVPVSDEVDCGSCHATGAVGALDYTVNWSSTLDPEVQAKENILLLHDARRGTNLVSQRPVLCVDCHYSVALDLALTGPVGVQLGNPILSHVLHRSHGQHLDPSGQPVIQPGGSMQATCYQCHPGKDAPQARGAHIAAGMECASCHGEMLAVGGLFDLLPGGSLDGAADGDARRAWIDLPRCQSCHTGDALQKLSGPNLVWAPDGIRLEQAWRSGDDSASPLLAVNKRFAENDDTLYRFSRGHGGVSCQACHGSTHAEWPDFDPSSSDNLAATQLQGHAGVLSACDSCHVEKSLPLSLSGPHGLHPIGDPRWAGKAHGQVYAADPLACQACHGLALEGTVLSRTATTRDFELPGGTTKVLAAGTKVSCDLCHAMP